jgi:putative ABC transport system permease protein
MVHHYIKTAIRNLLKSKLASLISIAGLAVALAGVFLVYAYVRWEMSYNHHFNGIENVYRVL